MKYRRHLRVFSGRLDFAPFAGVFFLLVLFLLLHSYLAPPPGLRIQLPAAESPSLPGTANPALVVSVDRNEQFYFDHQAVRPGELQARLAAKARHSREPVTLLVQADEAVRQAAIVRLAALARAAGIREVLIATRPALFPVGRGASGSNR
jgi:biopolymer transport protein ExbD